VSAKKDASTIGDDGIPVTSLPCSWNKPGKGPVSIETNIPDFNSKPQLTSVNLGNNWKNI